MKYKYVVIKEAYNIFEKSERIQSLMMQAFAIKLKSYKMSHKTISCPIEKIDFFSDQILIVNERDQVVSAYNIITNKMCEKYKCEFPLYTVAKSTFTNLDLQRLKYWINNKGEVGYNYAWGMSNAIPREERAFVKKMHLSFLKYYYEQNNIKTVLDINVLKLGIHKIKEDMGYKYFNDFPEVLAYESKCVLMYNEGAYFGDKFENNALEFKNYWLNKEVHSLENINKNIDIFEKSPIQKYYSSFDESKSELNQNSQELLRSA